MPEQFPYFAGVLASYFLRVAVAYAVFWLLSRLSPNPQRRFLLWLVFLLGAAGYWVAAFFPASADLAATSNLVALPVHRAALAPHTLFIPLSWAPFLALVARLLMAAYVLGVLLFLGNVVRQHLGLWRALRHAAEPSHHLRQLFGQMSRGFGMPRCRLVILPQLSSPATAGWWHPCVLLPEVCEEFNDSSQLADVLYHELIHVVRRDYLWAAISDLVRCLLFFHPAVWRARQHMRVQRELACDVAVVSGRPEHCADYAQSLTRFARLRMLQPGKSLGVDFAASASILGMRVRAVLSQRPRRSWWRTGVNSTLSLVLLVCFGLLWPVFGVVAQFAVPFQPAPAVVRPAQVARKQPAAHVRPHRPILVPARKTGLEPPQLATQSPPLVIQPPPAKQPKPPVMMAMSSSEFGPQSDDFDQTSPGAVSDQGEPNWSETRPLRRSRISVVTVVQHVAVGLAQIGRQQIGHEGRDHSGR